MFDFSLKSARRPNQIVLVTQIEKWRKILPEATLTGYNGVNESSQNIHFFFWVDINEWIFAHAWVLETDDNGVLVIIKSGSQSESKGNKVKFEFSVELKASSEWFVRARFKTGLFSFNVRSGYLRDCALKRFRLSLVKRGFNRESMRNSSRKYTHSTSKAPIYTYYITWSGDENINLSLNKFKQKSRSKWFIIVSIPHHYVVFGQIKLYAVTFLIGGSTVSQYTSVVTCICRL